MSIWCLLCTTPGVPGAQIVAPVEEVIVTATRTPVRPNDSLRPISVLNKEDIEFAQAADMLELLQVLPGLQFGRTGGRGGTTSLFLRGSNSNHLLVLVDGVRIGNANSGRAPWNEISPEQVERIELVRGPRSTLYGSDAIGGVVQIFTKGRQSQQQDRHSVRFSLGNRSAVRGDMQLHYERESYSASIGVSGYDTQGISHRDSGSINDTDSLRGRTARVALRRVLPGTDSKMGLNYVYTENTHEYDDFLPPADSPIADVYEENRLETVNAYYHYQSYPRWHSTLELGYARNDNESYDSFGGLETPSRFNSKHRSLHWLHSIDAERGGLWLVGIEHYRDSVEGENDSPESEDRDNDAAFVEYQYYGRLSQWTVSARTDDNEQYGSYSTYGLDWGINIGSSTKLTASYGEAFHAPTYSDLYGFGGNPELEPEESVNTEIGIRSQNQDYQWALYLFNNDIESLISIQFTPPATFTAVNVEKARIRGVEFQLSRHWERLRTDLSWTWLDPRNRTDDSILLRRARREAKLVLRYQVNDWDLGLQLLTRSKRFDFNKLELDPYTLVNLNARWRTHPQWELQFKIDNALDDDYQLAAGYNTEGPSATISARWQTP